MNDQVRVCKKCNKEKPISEFKKTIVNNKPYYSYKCKSCLNEIKRDKYKLDETLRIKNRARECFDFVLKTAGKHGYLAEQIDNNQMAPAWVIGLGWSHAMFVITLEKMIEKGLVK